MTYISVLTHQNRKFTNISSVVPHHELYPCVYLQQLLMNASGWMEQQVYAMEKSKCGAQLRSSSPLSLTYL